MQATAPRPRSRRVRTNAASTAEPPSSAGRPRTSHSARRARRDRAVDRARPDRARRDSPGARDSTSSARTSASPRFGEIRALECLGDRRPRLRDRSSNGSLADLADGGDLPVAHVGEVPEEEDQPSPRRERTQRIAELWIVRRLDQLGLDLIVQRRRRRVSPFLARNPQRDSPDPRSEGRLAPVALWLA